MKCLCKPGPKMSIHTKMQMKLQSGTYSANKPSLCASQCSPIRTLRGRKFQHCEHCFLSRNRGQSRLIKATSRSYGADDYGSKSPPSQKIVRKLQFLPAANASIGILAGNVYSIRKIVCPQAKNSLRSKMPDTAVSSGCYLSTLQFSLPTTFCTLPR